MNKLLNAVFAATMMVGLIVLGGCQTSQSGSSTNAWGSQNKSDKRIARSVMSPQPISVSEDAATYKSSVLGGKTEKPVKKIKKSKKTKPRIVASKKHLKRKNRSKKRPASRRGGRSYDAMIKRHAQANGVPYALARAVVQVESGFRANARGGVGEIGLMQLRKSTARGMGYRGSTKALYNPETNIKYGMRYLGRAYRLAGRSTCGAILKYNAGHAARRMNPISKRYCGKVRRIMRGRV